MHDSDTRSAERRIAQRVARASSSSRSFRVRSICHVCTTQPPLSITRQHCFPIPSVCNPLAVICGRRNPRCSEGRRSGRLLSDRHFCLLVNHHLEVASGTRIMSQRFLLNTAARSLRASTSGSASTSQLVAASRAFSQGALRCVVARSLVHR